LSIPKIGATDFGYRMKKFDSVGKTTPGPKAANFDERLAVCTTLRPVTASEIETGSKKDRRLWKTCCSPTEA
jgi:hypothetical protein